MTPRRAIPMAAPEAVGRHRSAVLGGLEEQLSELPSNEADLDGGNGSWSEFGPEAPHRQHVRRVFVAKYNPGKWGEPDDPQIWNPRAQIETWLWDSHSLSADRPANSSPALRSIREGDLVIVMRLRPTNDDKQPVHDNKGYNEHVLLGVWVPVLVYRYLDSASPLRTLRSGERMRLATEVWHVPLVRFPKGHEVRVGTIRSLDPSGLDLDPEFTEANFTLVEVKDPDGGRTAAARLLAACSLPGDLLTSADPLAWGPSLRSGYTGMRRTDEKYWQDMRYRHRLREVAEGIAVERSMEEVLRRGYDFPECWNRQGQGGWGGDFECWPVAPGVGPKRLAVEVKGTRFPNWLGKVKLQRSQYERAIRHAEDSPVPHERDYVWELHVQAGIPVRETEIDMTTLPPLEIRDAHFVKSSWKESWIEA